MSARYLSPERMIEAAGAAFACQDDETRAIALRAPETGFLPRLRLWAARLFGTGAKHHA
jgi:hypothetical protein